jgi:hypothetical protein
LYTSSMTPHLISSLTHSIPSPTSLITLLVRNSFLPQSVTFLLRVKKICSLTTCSAPMKVEIMTS